MKKTLIFCAVCILNLVSYAQNISTVVGNGIGGWLGDGGSALTAEINMPIGVCMDASGTLYVADQSNNCIRKVSTAGIITTIAGVGMPGYSGDNGPATLAKLNVPGAIFVNSTGTVYFADSKNHCIRKISTSGIITTIAGTGIAGFTGDGGPATAAQLYNPIGFTMDAGGNIFIGDQKNNRVRKINTSGIISTFAGTGAGGFGGDGGPALMASFYMPNYVILDAAGDLLVTDNGNHRVRKISTSGIVTTVAGNGIGAYSGDGGPATAAELRYPAGLTTDPTGNIYIADAYNSRIRKVTPGGIISTFAGTGATSFTGDGGPATAATFYNCIDICYSNHAFYIADYNNNRIRRIGVPSTAPHFTGGPIDTLQLCNPAAVVDLAAMLTAIDSQVSESLSWAILSAPAHGTLSGGFTTLSTGGALTPSGFYYTPALGYVGTDNFSITVSNGYFSDTLTFLVSQASAPNAGVISGIDSVCPGHTVMLSETVSGGIWSFSDGANTSISFSGLVTGIAPGTDTIIYTVINQCGISSAIFPFLVRSYTSCHTGVSDIAAHATVNVFPNPSDGTFTIFTQTSIPESAEMILTDATGRVMEQTSFITGQILTNKHDLTPGIYFLHLTIGQESVYQKIVVR
jgi:sugar lactone lactonase YvrE